jgi:high-affinity iron transporter
LRICFLMGLLAVAACGDPRIDEILELSGDEEAGAVLYSDNCAICHGDEGLGDIGSDLSLRVPEMSDEELVITVVNGMEGTTMPPFAEVFDNQSVADVVAYIKSGLGSE